MARELIDLYAVMQHIPNMLGMELTWKKDAWEGRYYLSGERHPYKKDKLKIKFWRNEKGCSIWLHEQGGDSMSLQNWLQRYGGAADWKEAMDMMRGNSRPDPKLLNLIRTGSDTHEVKYIDKSDYKACSLFDLRRCPLFVWMAGIYGEEQVRDVWAKYHVTTDGEGLAVFWYTNADGRICYDKRMKYKYDGHRDKTFGGTRRYTTAKGYTERPLFGAHLIGDSKEICVVESEKTALICALRYPDKVWVGTGGKNNLKQVEDNMVLYPDMDAIGYWSSKGASIAEWWLGDSSIGEHDDIADKIIRERIS